MLSLAWGLPPPLRLECALTLGLSLELILPGVLMPLILGVLLVGGLSLELGLSLIRGLPLILGLSLVLTEYQNCTEGHTR